MENFGIVIGIVAGICTIGAAIKGSIKWWKGKRNRDSTTEAPLPFQQHIHLHQEAGSDDEKLSPLEDEILVAMSKPSSRAVINEHFQMPRHLVIAGKKFVDKNDDLYRLQCLAAMNKLSDQEYIDETGDDVFCVAARGLERARKQDRGLDLPTPEEKPIGKVADDSIDISGMEEYLGSLSNKEFFAFYHCVKETRGVLLVFRGWRPSCTKEILDWKKLDPSRWIKACRLRIPGSGSDRQQRSG